MKLCSIQFNSAKCSSVQLRAVRMWLYSIEFRFSSAQCSPIQFSPIQFSPVHFSSNQFSPVHSVQSNPVQSPTFPYISILNSVQWTSVQPCSVQSSKVNFSPVKPNLVHFIERQFRPLQLVSAQFSPAKLSLIQPKSSQFNSIPATQFTSVQVSPFH